MYHIEILKVRTTVPQVNKSVDGFNIRFNTAEEWIIKVEDKSEENNQNAAWKNKRIENTKKGAPG